MTESKIARKKDRRSIYTEGVIRDALLTELEERPFDRVTIAAVCNRAEITRATFYLHYASLIDVVDAILEEALQIAEQAGEDEASVIARVVSSGDIAELREHPNVLPVCQRVADDPKYRTLFRDRTLSSYLVGAIYDRQHEKAVPPLMESCDISEEQATLLFRFMVEGAFAVNCSLGWKKTKAWYEFQAHLIAFAHGGAEALRVQGRAGKR